MKNIFLFSALLLLGFTTSAQKLFPLQSTEDSLSIAVTIVNGRPSLEWPANPAIFQPRKGFPRIVAVRLDDADLVVIYEAEPLKNDQSYNLSMRLSIAGEQIRPAPNFLQEGKVVSDKTTQRSLIWPDAAEDFLKPGNACTLYVKRSRMGAVNCSGVRPEFTLGKKLPHFAAGGVGLVLVGLGQVYQKQANDAYTQYHTLWEQGKLKTDAEQFYADATSKNKSANLCTYSGLAILGADLIWYALRRAKTKRSQTVYDQFCGQKTSYIRIDPIWQLPAGPAPGIAGMQLKFTF
jgi:hypothetical protein